MALGVGSMLAVLLVAMVAVAFPGVLVVVLSQSNKWFQLQLQPKPQLGSLSRPLRRRRGLSRRRRCRRRRCRRRRCRREFTLQTSEWLSTIGTAELCSSGGPIRPAGRILRAAEGDRFVRGSISNRFAARCESLSPPSARPLSDDPLDRLAGSSALVASKLFEGHLSWRQIGR